MIEMSYSLFLSLLTIAYNSLPWNICCQTSTNWLKISFMPELNNQFIYLFVGWTVHPKCTVNGLLRKTWDLFSNRPCILLLHFPNGPHSSKQWFVFCFARLRCKQWGKNKKHFGGLEKIGTKMAPKFASGWDDDDDCPNCCWERLLTGSRSIARANFVQTNIFGL